MLDFTNNISCQETRKINGGEAALEVLTSEQLNLENIKQIPDDKVSIEDFFDALVNEISSLKIEIKELKVKLSHSSDSKC